MFNQFNMSHLVPKMPGNLFADVKIPTLFGNEEKKKATAKKKPKPETGKKEGEVQALPEKEIICPYCKAKNKFPKGMTTRFCGNCGKAYFR